MAGREKRSGVCSSVAAARACVSAVKQRFWCVSSDSLGAFGFSVSHALQLSGCCAWSSVKFAGFVFCAVRSAWARASASWCVLNCVRHFGHFRLVSCASACTHPAQMRCWQGS
eukprot:3726425-Rhodomonas_salina.1